MSLLARAADKTGSLGSIVSAMSCAGCFPALANLGAALGLGFLGRYAGLFIDVLLRLFRCAVGQRAWLARSSTMAPPHCIGHGRAWHCPGGTVSVKGFQLERLHGVRRLGDDGGGIDLGSPIPGASPLRPEWLRTATDARLTAPFVSTTTEEQ